MHQRRTAGSLSSLLLLFSFGCGDGTDGRSPSEEAGHSDGADDASITNPTTRDGSTDIDAGLVDGGLTTLDGSQAQKEAGAPASGDSATPGNSVDIDATTPDVVPDAAPSIGEGGSAGQNDSGLTSDAGRNEDGSATAPANDAASTSTDAETSEVLPDAAVSDATVSDAGSDPVCSAAQAPAVGQLALQTIVSGQGLTGLTDAVQPPGSNDWYFVEQRGRVKVLRAGQTQLETATYMDLSEEIALPNAGSYDDRGLVSIAFAPDYASSGRVYVSVTPDRGAYANVDLLLEYTRSSTDPYRVDPASRRTILEVRGSRLDSNAITVNIHNGGRVAFGPDGMLYLAMGDGGSVSCGAIEPDATQDVGTLFGKMLRLDLSRPEPYGAADNPFVGSGDARVWQYGLRNPFRFSFDRLTGDLYLGDVGQTRYEEIDFAPSGTSGQNFGWAPYEGNSRDTCPTRELAAGSTHTPPVLAIDRRSGAVGPFADYEAIIGGVVYRGRALPQLVGAYLFGGYRSLRLGAFYQCGDQTSPVTPILKDCNPNQPNAACLERLDGGASFRELRAIVEDHDGEIYMVANGNSLLKVVPAQ